MDQPLLLNLNQDDFLFVGEGNEHLVFGINNSDSVLRFRKLSPGEDTRQEEFLRRVTNDVKFVNDVARTLAGSLLRDESHLIAVDSSLLEKVTEDIKDIRSEKRLFKSVNPFGLGVITPNVASAFTIRRSMSKTKQVPILTLDRNDDGDSFCLFSKGFSVDDIRGSAPCSPLSSSTLSQLPSHVLSTIQSNIESQEKVNRDPSTDGATSSSLSSVISKTPQCDSVVNRNTDCSSPNDLQTKVATLETIAPSDVMSDNDSFLSTRQDPKQELICVELKPKQGFLEPNFSGNGFLCRYCLKQHMKVANNTESKISSYCPLDLFSGDERLMSKALENLFNSPQNNLKIFSNGDRIHNCSQYKHISGIILKILQHNLYKEPLEGINLPVEEPLKESRQRDKIESQSTTSESQPGHATNSDEFLNKASNLRSLCKVPPVRSNLSNLSVLGKVLSVQCIGNLSEMQSACLYKEFSRREIDTRKISDFEFLIKDFSNLSVSSKNKSQEYSDINTVTEIWNGQLEDLNSDSLVQLVQEAMVSMSFKDLSIMILMQGPFANIPIEESSNQESPFWVQDLNQSFYKCQVTLVDLALKSVDRILEHTRALYKLENVLVDLQTKGDEPSCCKA